MKLYNRAHCNKVNLRSVPFPAVDIVRVVVVILIICGKFIRTHQCLLSTTVLHDRKHMYISSSYILGPA